MRHACLITSLNDNFTRSFLCFSQFLPLASSPKNASDGKSKVACLVRAEVKKRMLVSDKSLKSVACTFLVCCQTDGGKWKNTVSVNLSSSESEVGKAGRG